VTVLGWLGWAGSMLIRTMPGGIWWDVLKVGCPTAFLSLLILAPGKRARRCEIAARILNVATVRYESSPDLPESFLVQAGQRANETLRVERIRSAPPWIRGQRRRYRLKILAWICPALVAPALPAAAVILQWRWVEPWHCAVFVAVFVLYSVAALLGTRKLMKARDMLSESIERYQFESAATESDLEQAGKLATELLAARSGNSAPAA
jgi:hypothetical protein